MAEDTQTDTPPESAHMQTLRRVQASGMRWVYEPLDLSTIDADYTGTVNVLRNPTRLFRRTFYESSFNAQEMAAWLGFILNMTPDVAREWMDNVDQALYIYLIIGTMITDDNGKVRYQLGHIYQLWDEYAQGRAKKLFTR
jgi:hypothetical protein